MQPPRPGRRQFLGASAGVAGAMMGAQYASGEQGSGGPQRLPREVWIATISQAHLRANSSAGMVDRVLESMRAAAAFQPDVICLPETFPVANIDGRVAPLEERAEEGLGPVSTRMAEFAAEHHCYVICPLHTRDGDRFFNSALVIDRAGQLVGRYDKAHPTVDEMEVGIVPGPTAPPVFDTDFGRIGVQICFDVEWMDTWMHLSRNGADIVFWPSAFGGGSLVDMMAALHKYVVVSSTQKGASKICDLGGVPVANTSLWHRWIAAPINLEKALLATWPYVRRFNDIYRKYGQDIRITTFAEEEWSILESRSPEIRVSDILQEFELKTWSEHIAAADLLQSERRPHG